MTTPAQGQPADNVPSGGTDTNDTQQTQPNDPPYATYLSEIPEGLRSQVEPAFKKWDADVTQRFQGLHSEYEPYKQLIDEYDPQGLQYAVQLAEFMQENPKAFLEQFLAASGLAQEQGTQGNQPPSTQQQQQAPDNDDPYAAQFAAMQQQIEQLTGLLQGQTQAQQQAQAQQQVEQIIQGLHAKHGEFDDVYVLTMMGNGMNPEQAVQSFKDTVSKFGGGNANPAPTLIPAGGHSVPQVTAEDLASGKVSSKDLVVQMLKSAAEQG